jgi:branched-chain amino acid transport system ATP-binding protein
VKQGLAMVPEGRGVFTRMTITENLQMGAYIRSDKAEASWPTLTRCSPSSRA